MLHDEKEMTDGHDVYDAPNIFKAVNNQFQMIDFESRAFMCLDNIVEEQNTGITLSLISSDFNLILQRSYQ